MSPTAPPFVADGPWFHLDAMARGRLGVISPSGRYLLAGREHHHATERRTDCAVYDLVDARVVAQFALEGFPESGTFLHEHVCMVHESDRGDVQLVSVPDGAVLARQPGQYGETLQVSHDRKRALRVESSTLRLFATETLDDLAVVPIDSLSASRDAMVVPERVRLSPDGVEVALVRRVLSKPMPVVSVDLGTLAAHTWSSPIRAWNPLFWLGPHAIGGVDVASAARRDLVVMDREESKPLRWPFPDEVNVANHRTELMLDDGRFLVGSPYPFQDYEGALLAVSLPTLAVTRHMPWHAIEQWMTPLGRRPWNESDNTLASLRYVRPRSDGTLLVAQHEAEGMLAVALADLDGQRRSEMVRTVSAKQRSWPLKTGRADWVGFQFASDRWSFLNLAALDCTVCP